MAAKKAENAIENDTNSQILQGIEEDSDEEKQGEIFSSGSPRASAFAVAKEALINSVHLRP